MYQELLTNIKKRDIGVRLAIALVAAVLIVYFYPHPESTHYNYEEGRPWNYAKLIAPFDIPIHPDSNTIRAARDSLTARFVPCLSDRRRGRRRKNCIRALVCLCNSLHRHGRQALPQLFCLLQNRAVDSSRSSSLFVRQQKKQFSR